MAKLAIKGHPTRGKEVIEILEMLGGKNIYSYFGNGKNLIYFINSDFHGSIGGSTELDIHSYKLYSLEDFLENFPYKVGDKLEAIYGKIGIVKQLVWSNKDNAVRYVLEDDEDSLYFSNELQPYKEENMEEKKINQISLVNCDLDEVEIVLGNRFELKTKDGKYYVVRKKLEYPKTFIEVLDFWHPDRQLEDDYQRDYKKDLIEKFQDLLYARDAYWKIAGREMGLDKLWKPDWKDCTKPKYTIHLHCDGHIFHQDVSHTEYRWLSFPTAEMRDAFYENFKDLIEKCKELL